jgi:hypothetical protein
MMHPRQQYLEFDAPPRRARQRLRLRESDRQVRKVISIDYQTWLSLTDRLVAPDRSSSVPRPNAAPTESVSAASSAPNPDRSSIKT